MSLTSQTADVAVVRQLPPMPRGFSVQGLNGKDLRVRPRQFGMAYGLKLLLQVDDSTASVKPDDIDTLIAAVRSNFYEELGFRQRSFTGGASLSVFGGTTGAERCVSFLCGGQTVRLGQDGVSCFLEEMQRIDAGIAGFLRERRMLRVPSLVWS